MLALVIKGLALTSAFLILRVGILYSKKIFRDPHTDPSLGTWTIFEVGVLMSMVTYFSGPKHSILNDVTNLADMISVTIILVALIRAKKGLPLSFLPSEWCCLAISAGAIAVWLITGTAWLGVFGFQVMMVVAYWPTFRKIRRCMREVKRSSEPQITWGINAFAASLGIVIAVLEKDWVAILYPLRGTILCLTVVVLARRTEERWIMAGSPPLAENQEAL